jgi:hypothetical protein
MDALRQSLKPGSAPKAAKAPAKKTSVRKKAAKKRKAS